ncbi:MAG TPA: hypothetical protein VGD68_03600 [Streptosporangiaceae bacterium]
MDTASAVEELSTIARTSGQTELANQVAGEEGRVEIGRYAARLAAFERAVLPVAERRLDDGKARAEQVREGGQQLTSVLYWLDRHLTGDVHATTWPGGDLSHDVQAAAATYAQMEHGLIGELAGALDEGDMTDLIRSYHQAEQVAPTRPHPKLSYGGALGGLTYRLAGLVDDVRDGTESRPAGPVVGSDAAHSLRELDEHAATDS